VTKIQQEHLWKTTSTGFSSIKQDCNLWSCKYGNCDLCQRTIPAFVISNGGNSMETINP